MFLQSCALSMCYRNRKTKAEDGELKIVDLPTIGKIAPDFLRLTMWGLFSRVAKFTIKKIISFIYLFIKHEYVLESACV